MAITIPSGSTFTRNNRTRTWLIMVGVLVALLLIAWLTLNAITAEVRRQVHSVASSRGAGDVALAAGVVRRGLK